MKLSKSLIAFILLIVFLILNICFIVTSLYSKCYSDIVLSISITPVALMIIYEYYKKNFKK